MTILLQVKSTENTIYLHKLIMLAIKKLTQANSADNTITGLY